MIFAAVSVEPLQRVAYAAVHRAPGCSESHRLVSSPARVARLRRGNGGSLHTLLEHTYSAATTVH